MLCLHMFIYDDITHFKNLWCKSTSTIYLSREDDPTKFYEGKPIGLELRHHTCILVDEHYMYKCQAAVSGDQQLKCIRWLVGLCWLWKQIIIIIIIITTTYMAQ